MSSEYKLLSITPSTKSGKKMMAKFKNLKTEREKTIHFGASGYRDFTLMNNKNSQYYVKDSKKRNQVKTNYQTRHAKDLQTENGKKGLSAGALSYYVLWTAPTVAGGIRNYKSKYRF
jgi:cupin superfamily acireductone dioxygenase involved in methionine salvage